jgi:hypothetical protein
MKDKTPYRQLERKKPENLYDSERNTIFANKIGQ